MLTEAIARDIDKYVYIDMVRGNLVRLKYSMAFDLPSIQLLSTRVIIIITAPEEKKKKLKKKFRYN